MDFDDSDLYGNPLPQISELLHSALALAEELVPLKDAINAALRVMFVHPDLELLRAQIVAAQKAAAEARLKAEQETIANRERYENDLTRAKAARRAGVAYVPS